MKYIWLFIKTLLRMLLKPLSFVPAIVMMYVIFNFLHRMELILLRLAKGKCSYGGGCQYCSG